MRRSVSLLVLALVLAALALGGRSVGAAGSAAASKTSPFPGGLSLQWLNVANVEPTACLAKLAASGAKYTVLPAQEKPNAKGCGVPHGVLVTRGPTKRAPSSTRASGASTRSARTCA